MNLNPNMNYCNKNESKETILFLSLNNNLKEDSIFQNLNNKDRMNRNSLKNLNKFEIMNLIEKSKAHKISQFSSFNPKNH